MNIAEVKTLRYHLCSNEHIGLSAFKFRDNFMVCMFTSRYIQVHTRYANMRKAFAQLFFNAFGSRA